MTDVARMAACNTVAEEAGLQKLALAAKKPQEGALRIPASNSVAPVTLRCPVQNVAAETGKAAGKYHLLRKYLLQQELDTVRARHHRCDAAHPPAVSLFEGVHDGETATARGSKEESRRGCHGGTKTRRRGGPGQHCNHSLFNTPSIHRPLSSTLYSVSMPRKQRKS